MPDIIKSLSQVPKTGKVIIDFFATWCGPCTKLAPFYDEFATQFPNVTFLKVDVDDCDEELPNEYDVQALPTLVLINNGTPITLIKGANPDRLKTEIESLNKTE
jgi:thioredoxin 1